MPLSKTPAYPSKAPENLWSLQDRLRGSLWGQYRRIIPRSRRQTSLPTTGNTGVLTCLSWDGIALVYVKMGSAL
ncbi:hypothetical protein K504DRAFT_463234, partial [Pleomassaria siparia CBS 279.74]